MKNDLYYITRARNIFHSFILDDLNVEAFLDTYQNKLFLNILGISPKGIESNSVLLSLSNSTFCSVESMDNLVADINTHAKYINPMIDINKIDSEMTDIMSNYSVEYDTLGISLNISGEFVTFNLCAYSEGFLVDKKCLFLMYGYNEHDLWFLNLLGSRLTSEMKLTTKLEILEYIQKKPYS